MIGLAELLIVLVLSASLYLCLSPPAWYTSSQKLTFIRRYGGLVKQQQLKSFVGGIGLNLARAANYQEEPLEFFVLKSQVPNAFAWDSKTVFVTMGLLELAESKDELAAVLAHEIGHLAAGHPEARAMNRAQSILLSSSFSGMGWVMNKIEAFKTAIDQMRPYPEVYGRRFVEYHYLLAELYRRVGEFGNARRQLDWVKQTDLDTDFIHPSFIDYLDDLIAQRDSDEHRMSEAE